MKRKFAHLYAKVRLIKYRYSIGSHGPHRCCLFLSNVENIDHTTGIPKVLLSAGERPPSNALFLGGRLSLHGHLSKQGRFNQWVHWARAQGPRIFFFLRGPQLAVVKFFFKLIILLLPLMKPSIG